MRPHLLAILSLLMAGLALDAAENRLAVVTGTTIVQDLTVRIGGDRVASTCLLKAGIDPHAYQPVPEDVRRLAAAQVVIINGLGFEGWFEGLAKESGFAGRLVIASRGIQPLKMEAEDDHDHGHGHDHGHAHGKVDDPHAFNAISNGVVYAENIRDALVAADPAGAAGYRDRAAALIAELRATDAWARQTLATLPRNQRTIITNHDAMQYFAKEYGFAILSPNTALEDSQPSADEVAKLIGFIRGKQVKGVFLEFGKNDKLIAQIASEAQVRIGGELYLDGVGPPGSPASTYVGAFRANVQAIVDALR